MDGGRCRFVQPNGTLSGNRRCDRPILLRAQGTSRWRLELAAKLEAGSYRIVSRAVDAAGNREAQARDNTLDARVRGWVSGSGSSAAAAY
jgi:hypothetical protein